MPNPLYTYILNVEKLITTIQVEGSFLSVFLHIVGLQSFIYSSYILNIYDFLDNILSEPQLFSFGQR